MGIKIWTTGVLELLLARHAFHFSVPLSPSRFHFDLGVPPGCPAGWLPSQSAADRKRFLPASCDRWTAGRRSPWPRHFSPPHRGLSARLEEPLPWRPGTRHGLPIVAATGTRSGQPGRSSLGSERAAAPRMPAHVGETRENESLWELLTLSVTFPPARWPSQLRLLPAAAATAPNAAP
jgi:hypothetical protein